MQRAPADGYGEGVNVQRVLKNAGIIGVWEYDLERGSVTSDTAMAIAYGVDPQDAHRGVPPERFREAIHPADLDQAKWALIAAIASQSEYRIRYRIRGPQDRWVLIEAHGHTIAKSGLTRCVAGVNRLAAIDTTNARDALSDLASLVIRANEIASLTGEKDVRFFAELLLNEVSKSLAAREQISPSTH